MIHNSDKENDDFDDFDDFDEFDDFDDDLGDIEDLEITEDKAPPAATPPAQPPEQTAAPAEDLEDPAQPAPASDADADFSGGDDDWDEFEDMGDFDDDDAPASPPGAVKSGSSAKGKIVLFGGIAAIALMAGGGYYLMQGGPAPGTSSMPPAPAEFSQNNAVDPTSAVDDSALPVPSPISNYGETVEEEYVPEYQLSLEEELEASNNPSSSDDEFMTTDQLRQDSSGQDAPETGAQQFLTPEPAPLSEAEMVDLEPLEDLESPAPADTTTEIAQIEEPQFEAPEEALTSAEDFQEEVDRTPLDISEPMNNPAIAEQAPEPEIIPEDPAPIPAAEEMPAMETPDISEPPAVADQNVAPAAPQNTALNEELEEANATIDTLSGKVSELESTIAALNEELEALKNRPSAAPDPAPKSPAPAPAAEAAKPKPQPSSKPAPAKTASKPRPAANADIWTMRSAQPGRATLYNKKTSDVLVVETGQTVRGLGKITYIGPESGRWIVRGSQGSVRQ